MATTPGYDPKKAALFNQLRQGGLSEDAAVAQAGITDAETTNYAIGMNGQMGALIIGAGTRPGVEIVRTVDYDEKADAPVSSKTPTNYTTTSTETVSGGGSTTIIAGARQPTPASQAFAAEGDAKQAEIDQFSRENPSNFMRKRQGLPALTPEENEARIAKLNTLQDQRSQIYNQQLAAENVSPPTVITVPNTTTTTQTVTSGTTSVNTAVPAPAGADPVINQQTEQQLGVAVGAANENTTATAVGNTSDPYAASREAALLEANDIPVTKTDVASDPNTNPNGEVASQAEQIQSQNAQALASDPNTNPNGEAGSQTEIAAQIQNQNAQALASDPNTNVGGTVEQRTQSEQIQNQNAQALASDPNTNVGGEVEQRPRTIEDDTGSSIQQAAKLRAQAQASLQQQRKQANDGDWRVRLRLAPGANYLYRATDGKGTQAGILQPLAVTDGVIFPYTPQIQTGYRANYNTYDLTHSNYRGYFYQGSQVAPVRRTALFIHQLDQPQFGFGPQRFEIFYFERLNEHRRAFFDMAIFGQRRQ